MSNQLGILTNARQYHHELSLLPRLVPDEERELRNRARVGDEQARSSLVENCLRYVAYIAAHYKRYVHHDDYLDLVGVGNLAVVEYAEKALVMDSPCAYLFTVARYTIIDYCMTHASLITKSRDSDAPDPFVGSLDAPISQDGHTTLIELLVAPKAEQERVDRDYAWLYKALNTLSEKHRKVLIRHYGLNGSQTESLYKMSRAMSANPGPKSCSAYLIEYRALARLRRYFETIA